MASVHSAVCTAGFLCSFATAEKLQESWKHVSFPHCCGDLATGGCSGAREQAPCPAPRPAVPRPTANALVVATGRLGSQGGVCGFASWAQHKALGYVEFVVFPELHLTNKKKKKKEEEEVEKSTRKESGWRPCRECPGV